MTDRINSFVVVLDKNIRDDDAENTIIALKNIKGVIGVIPNINSISDTVAGARAKSEIINKILDLVDSINKTM